MSENENTTKGCLDNENDENEREVSMLQALALLRVDEEFRLKYGTLQDLLVSRREASVARLCDIIVRLKKELEGKNKCAEMMQDILGWWKALKNERNQLLENNQELEMKNADLERKIEELRQNRQQQQQQQIISVSTVVTDNASPPPPTKRHKIRQDNRPAVAATISATAEKPTTPLSFAEQVSRIYGNECQDYDKPQDSEELAIATPGCFDGTFTCDNDGNNGAVTVINPEVLCLSQSQMDEASCFSSDRNRSGGMTSFGTSTLHISRTNNYGILEGFTSQTSSSSVRADFSHPLLSTNPYGSGSTNNHYSFGSSYYNPTQFFHRVSTASASITARKGMGKTKSKTTLNKGSTSGTRGKSGIQRKLKLKSPVKKAQSKRSKKEPAMEICTAPDEEIDSYIDELLKHVRRDGNDDNPTADNENEPVECGRTTGFGIGEVMEHETHDDNNRDNLPAETEENQTRKEGDPSSEQCYFDYTSTYLDATEPEGNVTQYDS